MVFPAAAMTLAVACTVVMTNAAFKRPSGAKIAWSIAFVLFTIAAACELVGAAAGWSPLLVRLYYLSGAVLVVGYLALGELYLLFPRYIDRTGPGAALLVTAISAAMVWDAPVDPARLAIDGWRALERGPTLTILAALVNGLGSLIVVAGALWSTWRLARGGGSRRRAIGCALIAAGVMVAASGGWLTRFGRPEFLYLSMALGLALILFGCLESVRPTENRKSTSRAARSIIALDPLRTPAMDRVDPGIDYLVGWLTRLDSEAILRNCLDWSATPVPQQGVERSVARSVWALRLKLPDEARTRFDQLPMATRGMLAEVYHEVFIAPLTGGQQHLAAS